MHQLGRRGGLHVFRVLTRPLQPPAAPLEIPGIVVRVLSTDELLRHCTPQLDLSQPMVRDAGARGDVCIGALAGGDLAGYVWFAREAAPHLQGVWVQVPGQAIYRYKAFVSPAYRGRRIASALDAFAERLFQGGDRRWVVTCIATHNFPALAASKVSGAQTLGYLGYWQRGARFAAFHSAAVRKFGLRFYFRGDGNA
jgi:hypothetical protein